MRVVAGYVLCSRHLASYEIFCLGKSPQAKIMPINQVTGCCWPLLFNVPGGSMMEIATGIITTAQTLCQLHMPVAFGDLPAGIADVAISHSHSRQNHW
jgi:hypothetical protein